jgi:hypothetical protein
MSQLQSVETQVTKKITEGGQTTSSQDAAEKARRSGMTKGTAGAAETGSEDEQGSAGSNKQEHTTLFAVSP